MADIEKIDVTQSDAAAVDDSLNSPLEPLWTEEEERAVRRKIDFHCVPIVTLMYLLCFVCLCPPQELNLQLTTV
jgi:hypothetical protein